MSEGIAGAFIMGDGLQQIAESAQPPVYWPFKSEADLAAFVERIVRKVLEDDAREIRENKAFQPVQAQECSRAAWMKPEQREHRG